MIGGVQPTALVDTCSTHTFIHSEVPSCLGWPMTPHAGPSVMVANGDRVRSPSMCATTDVAIHNEHFSIDCFPLDLGGFDLALGVHWLCTLGPSSGTSTPF
jgi:hypothetical protein